MRQAGRYLPEYQQTRTKAGSFLDLVYHPELAAEVTLQPIRRFGFDAAILFSDILVVPHLLGQTLTFQEGEGPRLGPLDIKSLVPDYKKSDLVAETVRLVKQQLPADCALIGFAGSPFTVAAYMVEGGGSAVFDKTRDFSRRQPAEFEKLIDKIITATLDYLEGQIAAGAEVIQLFDSHAGHAPNFQRWVIEPTAAITMILKAKYPHVPIIGFPRGAGLHLPAYAAHTGVDAIGLDQSVKLDWALEHLPKRVTLQGNLDPQLLIKGGAELDAGIDAVLAAARTRPWIFNLGHGIDKTTPIAHVEQLINRVRSAK